jgi:DNA-binding NtrC family response regulator
LVLLDIWMPDTDGVTLLKEWSANGLLNMPVIMMSGHATIDTAVEATRIGAIDFLEKPITLQRLLKTISNGLNRHKPLPKVAATAAPTAVAIETVTAQASPSTDASSAQGNPEQSNPAMSGDIALDQPLREARDAFERVYFEYHLTKENFSMTRVSERTGLERTHLYRKLKQLGIESRKRNLS